MRLALAPAGVPARGGLDVRPAVGGCTPPASPSYARLRPVASTGSWVVAPTAPSTGTGLPAAGSEPEPFGTPVTGTPAIGTGALVHDSFQRTTLGIHSPGSPAS